MIEDSLWHLVQRELLVTHVAILKLTFLDLRLRLDDGLYKIGKNCKVLPLADFVGQLAPALLVEI